MVRLFVLKDHFNESHILLFLKYLIFKQSSCLLTIFMTHFICYCEAHMVCNPKCCNIISQCGIFDSVTFKWTTFGALSPQKVGKNCQLQNIVQCAAK